TDISLTGGEHILRVAINQGEFNLGRMTFTRTGDLGFDPPVADAGSNVSATLSSTTVTLDGSATYEPSGKTVTYTWSQVYGPTTLTFSSTSSATPQVSNLAIGVYKCLLTVSDGTYTSNDDMKIIVSESGNANPSVTITSPSDGASFAEGATIDLTAQASDLDGTITLVEFFAGETKIGEDFTDPFESSWTNVAPGDYQITAKATDDIGATSTSQAINISVNEVLSCVITDNEAAEGSFSVGYEMTFETVGSNVNITIELLDSEKAGVVAYLWRKVPDFQESQMDHVSGTTFTKTIGGLSTGQSITYAVKFAYAGGLSVTKDMTYTVGNSCSGSSTDTQGPTNFTASVGTIGSRAVELLLQADDGSGSVVYDVAYGGEQTSVTGDSGVQTSLVINNLSPETTYNFSISAKDISQNTASNNPIALQATTTADTNTNCSGTETQASQGSFTTGYTYSFVTNGTSVTFTFELLDTDKSGVVAYLWRESPFSETPMSGSGNSFSITVNDFTIGETISYACKFAFAGGLAVTQYFSYQVGDNCALSSDQLSSSNEVFVYPNPADKEVFVSVSQGSIDSLELYTINGIKIKKATATDRLQVDELASGLYLIKVYQKGQQSFHRIIVE
ncbi:MAG: Ig-like domain-containing protein, partial [Flavobacteriaceae bacterium]